MPESIDAKVTWIDAQTGEPHETVKSIALGELLQTSGPQLEKARVITTYAEALKTLDQKRLQAAHETALSALSRAPNDLDLQEIADLIAKHPGF
jgi:hypothetical protein